MVNAFRYSGPYGGECLRKTANSLDNDGIELVTFEAAGPIVEFTNTVGLMGPPTLLPSHSPSNGMQ